MNSITYMVTTTERLGDVEKTETRSASVYFNEPVPPKRHLMEMQQVRLAFDDSISQSDREQSMQAIGACFREMED